MKKKFGIAMLLIVIVVFLLLCSRSTKREDIWVGDTVAISNEGITYKYKVVGSAEGVDFVEEAVLLVEKWWNNDDTFNIPKVGWIKNHEGELRGIEHNSVAFINVDLGGDELMLAVVHDIIHAQNENALKKASEVNEMIVEGIAMELLDGIPDDVAMKNYSVLKNTKLWDHHEELYELYRTIPGLKEEDVAKVLGCSKETIAILNRFLKDEPIKGDEEHFLKELLGE